MPNTTNFNWPTPADTDLVKDGAAAIRNLGDGVDTSLVDLKGGTTGQILSKASNADMDFAFITPNVGDLTEVQAGTGISVASGTGPIPIVTNTMATEITAKGDLIVGTGSGTFDNLPAGTNGFTLVADSVETTGLKWVAPAGGSLDFTLLNAGGTSLTGSGTITVSSINHKALFIKIVSGSTTSAGDINLRFNSDSGSNYDWASVGFIATTADSDSSFGTSGILFGNVGNAASSISTSVLVFGADKTGYKPVQIVNSGNTSQTGAKSRVVSGGYFGSSAISSVSVVAGSNWDAGTIYVYGAA